MYLQVIKINIIIIITIIIIIIINIYIIIMIIIMIIIIIKTVSNYLYYPKEWVFLKKGIFVNSKKVNIT